MFVMSTYKKQRVPTDFLYFFKVDTPPNQQDASAIINHLIING
jgi:hypothetical protein